MTRQSNYIEIIRCRESHYQNTGLPSIIGAYNYITVKISSKISIDQIFLFLGRITLMFSSYQFLSDTRRKP
jgi:hypothetical protein